MAAPLGAAPPARRLRRIMHLSKIRGAANGKVKTSRGRQKSAQEYMEPLRECRRNRHISVKREPLNPLYRKGKRAFRVS
jgi:hypothetical protein